MYLVNYVIILTGKYRKRFTICIISANARDFRKVPPDSGETCRLYPIFRKNEHRFHEQQMPSCIEKI